MTVEQQLAELARREGATGIDLHFEPQPGGMRGYPWRITLFRDRPIHCTQAHGNTIREAIADLERVIAL